MTGVEEACTLAAVVLIELVSIVSEEEVTGIALVAVCVVDGVGAIAVAEGGERVQSIESQFAAKSKQKFSQTCKLLMLTEVDPP